PEQAARLHHHVPRQARELGVRGEEPEGCLIAGSRSLRSFLERLAVEHQHPAETPRAQTARAGLAPALQQPRTREVSSKLPSSARRSRARAFCFTRLLCRDEKRSLGSFIVSNERTTSPMKALHKPNLF